MQHRAALALCDGQTKNFPVCSHSRKKLWVMKIRSVSFFIACTCHFEMCVKAVVLMTNNSILLLQKLHHRPLQKLWRNSIQNCGCIDEWQDVAGEATPCTQIPSMILWTSSNTHTHTHTPTTHSRGWYFNTQTGQYGALSVCVVSCESLAADFTFNHNNRVDTKYSQTHTERLRQNEGSLGLRCAWSSIRSDCLSVSICIHFPLA